jgi:RNA-binding protein
MESPVLSTSEKKRLKALAHGLKPVVHIGREGVSAQVAAAVAKALADHELIKVRFLETSGLNRKSESNTLAARTGSHCIQVLGRNAVLYRPGAASQPRQH